MRCAVNAVVPRRVSRAFPVFLATLGAFVLTGCSFLWVTPPPQAETPAPSSSASPRAPFAPRVTATPTMAFDSDPLPTPTIHLDPLTIVDAPVQYWSDPNDVSGLLRDGDYLWAATTAGMVRWSLDGAYRLFTTEEGLASQAVRGLAQDGEGHIWVGYADEGAWSFYDGQRWRSYPTREEAVETHYLAMLQALRFDPRLFVSRADSDWLWLPKDDGRLEAYDGERWRVYGTYEGVTSHTWLVSISDDGRVWAVGTGVSTAEEGERWWDDHDLFSEIGGREQVTGITVDGQGRLWLAFAGIDPEEGGVCRFDLEENRWAGYAHSLNPSIPSQVYGLEVDREGAVWLYGQGGVVVRQPARPWTLTALDGAAARCAARDKDGRLWVGTSRGVCVLSDDGRLSRPWLIPSPLLDNTVTALAADDRGRLWIGTPSGLSYVSASGEAGVLTTEAIVCLALDRSDRLWVGTETGLYQVEADDTLTNRFEGDVVAVAFDAANVPWVCTAEGRFVRVNLLNQRVPVDLLELVDTLPHDMVIDSQGTIWFSLAVGLGQLSPQGEFHLFTVEEGLLSQDVRAVALGPDDELWMATAKGLARRLPSGRWTRFTTESTGGGLRAMEMWDVHVDAQGTLWMATSAGLSSRTPASDWSYFDSPQARSVVVDPSGAVWLGTPNGLYRLQPEVMTPVP